PARAPVPPGAAAPPEPGHRLHKRLPPRRQAAAPAPTRRREMSAAVRALAPRPAAAPDVRTEAAQAPRARPASSPRSGRNRGRRARRTADAAENRSAPALRRTDRGGLLAQ